MEHSSSFPDMGMSLESKERDPIQGLSILSQISLVKSTITMLSVGPHNTKTIFGGKENGNCNEDSEGDRSLDLEDLGRLLRH